MANIIGEPIDRIDGRLKVTGGARYAYETPLDNAAHGLMVQSTIGRGRILEIDTQAAEAAPGVLLVLTHKNAPPPASAKGSKMQPGEAWPLLQDDRILYNGQHIALIIAETREQAGYAAQLLRIRYQEEPPTALLDAAIDKAAVPKNFRGGSRPPDSRRGDPDTAFAAAPVRIDRTYVTPVEHHNPMEPHAVAAAWQSDGSLIIFPSTQGISGTRKSLAGFLGIAEDRIRVINPFVGGGFGTKGANWPHVTLTAVAARMVGRPVKLELTRRQMYTSNGFRPKTIQHLRLGADRNGKLVAVRHDTVTQTAIFGEWVEPCGLATEMMYACPNLAVTHRVAAVNAGIPTFMRAPGEASGMYALESAMDELAVALKFDPLELRLRNYAERDEHAGLPWSSKSLRQCYEKGAAAFGWARRTAEPGAMRDGDVLIGWGMASATYPANRSAAGATVILQQDGTAIVESGTQDIGTGSYTIMAQVAAATLGLPLSRVRARLGDSTLPPAPASGGSQSAASVTPAVQAAAQEVRRQLLALAGATKGPLQGAAAADLQIADGVISRTAGAQTIGNQTVTVADLLKAAGHDRLAATSDVKPGAEKKQYSMHAFGAHFVEVRVDPELGEVRVSRYVGAFAAGRVLNAKTARSQLLGGIVFGLGMGLLEETDYDPRTARVMNANVAEYLLPVHADVPDIDIIMVEEEDPYINPLGVKGMGELPNVGTAAAIANAVYHATGRRVRDLPIRVEKLMA